MYFHIAHKQNKTKQNTGTFPKSTNGGGGGGGGLPPDGCVASVSRYHKTGEHETPGL